MEKKPHALKGKPKSENQKEKLRQANLGKKRSQESIDKQRNTLKKRYQEGTLVSPTKGKPAWNRGIKHKPESIQKQKDTIKRNRELGKYKSRKGIPSPVKGCKRSEEFKEKLRAVVKTKEWNRKNSEAQKGEKNHRFGVVVSDEYRKKMSECVSGENNGMFGKTHSPEARAKQSLAAIKRIQKGNNQRAVLSLPEKKVMAVLENNIIVYQPQFVLLNQTISKWKSYDFYLPKYNLLLEIDGIYWHGKSISQKKLSGIIKKNRFNDILKNNLALDSGYRLLRIWEDELDKLENLIKNNFMGLEYMEINDSNKDNYFENLVYLQ